MNSFNDILVRQTSAIEELGKLLTNHTKDGADRKTKTYLEVRRQTFEDLMAPIVSDHEKLEAHRAPGKPYFDENSFDVLNRLFTKIMTDIDGRMALLASKASSGTRTPDRAAKQTNEPAAPQISAAPVNNVDGAAGGSDPPDVERVDLLGAEFAPITSRKNNDDIDKRPSAFQLNNETLAKQMESTNDFGGSAFEKITGDFGGRRGDTNSRDENQSIWRLNGMMFDGQNHEFAPRLPSVSFKLRNSNFGTCWLICKYGWGRPKE